MPKKKPKKEYQYYLNPITDDLIILDMKANEIIAVPMIEEVSYEGKPYTEGDEKKYEESEEKPTGKSRKPRLKGYRRAALSPKKIQRIKEMTEQEIPVALIAKGLEISVAAVYKYQKKKEEPKFRPVPPIEQ